ncbi:hypothetical protein [Microbacterium sp. WCS2018Hpa-9]|uniref:hypothetical protein n=1 Tax=Microbacterium sp. WCS2018Hpa-9 TaxID=3073635 RepID=UPI00288C11FD|nr:hypothetical protein [Microbacterium sp. WCS2018Hpa-9]
MDLSQTLEPNSQQVNADDLTAAPRTVSITNVTAGTAEQPVFIHLSEFPGRTYRPGKSMRRVLVQIWGAEASNYVGRKLRLYNDQTIRFGKDVTGGIRISHASHIDAPVTVNLTVTRGRRAPFVVQPLPDAPPVDPTTITKALHAITNATDTTTLDGIEKHAHTLGIHTDITDAIKQKRAQLKG